MYFSHCWQLSSVVISVRFLKYNHIYLVRAFEYNFAGKISKGKDMERRSIGPMAVDTARAHNMDISGIIKYRVLMS